jgi:hypothetical protein
MGMRQRAKQVFAYVYAAPRRLGEKSAFVAIWGGVAIHHRGTTRAGQATRRLLSVLIPAGLRQGTRQRVKRVLIRVPGLRSYLVEKYTLQESWYRVAAERDAIKLERNRFETEVERLQVTLDDLAAERAALRKEHEELWTDIEKQRDGFAVARVEFEAELQQQGLALEAITAERDSLLAARDQLHAEVEPQGAAHADFVAEREALTVERTNLQADVEQHRVAVESLLSERDALLSERENLLRHVEAVEAERNQLLADVTRLQKHVEESQLQRSNYQDAMLGKLVTVQSQFNTLQRSLLRLCDIPNGAIADELSRDLYLDLLEESLIGTIIRDESIAAWHQGYDQTRRELGRDWPKFAFTMIGKARMRNIREVTETILSEGVPGDLLEAGVWRGGACIYMRGILKARGITNRTVWVADSFAGLPPPNAEEYPADKDDPHHSFSALAISLEEVRDNFSKFGLLDEQVQFLQGWFKDTLAEAPIKRLALLRLDGDMYESTIQTLDAMYWRLSPKGFVIVDDYILPNCKKAVDDFRNRHRITAKLEMIDGAAVYWRRQPNEKMMMKRTIKRRERV